MYVAIDIGGTKTLVASLNGHGVIQQKIRFETPKTYDEFLNEVASALGELKTKDFVAGGIGAPGTAIDRKHGRVGSFGNLPWKNVSLQDDIERLTHCPMALDNDAKLAALSEAMILKHEYNKVLYVTISTGIGLGLVVNQRLDTNFGDGGGRTFLVEYHGQMTPWEDFAAGSSLVKRFGQMAKDIEDPAIWEIFMHDVGRGLIELIALTQPEVVVIGGSVGTYFHKYGKILQKELQKYKTPLLPIPPVRPAERPEEAVLFGCYDLARITYPHSQVEAK